MTSFDKNQVLRYEVECWDPALSFFIDAGSIFPRADKVDVVYPSLEVIEHHCKGKWEWTIDEITVYEESTDAQDLLDVMQRLWIHFDNVNDAMLSRIALDDLRNSQHAHGGRLPKRTGNPVVLSGHSGI